MLFVDDLLITGSDSNQIHQMETLLGEKYKMKDLGVVKGTLELNLIVPGLVACSCTSPTILMNLSTSTTCTTGRRHEFTPLPLGLVLDAETSTVVVDTTMYCRAVGKLIFLTHTQPDISHGVGIVSRFMQHLQQAHWGVVSHLLRYISTIVNFGTRFGILSSRSGLPSSLDSQMLTRRSIGAYVFKLAIGPVSWSNKQQPTVSDSTTEAEYKALSEGAKEVVYICKLFLELGLGLALTVPITIDHPQVHSNAPTPTKFDLHLQCDNQSVVKLAKNPIFMPKQNTLRANRGENITLFVRGFLRGRFRSNTSTHRRIQLICSPSSSAEANSNNTEPLLTCYPGPQLILQLHSLKSFSFCYTISTVLHYSGGCRGTSLSLYRTTSWAHSSYSTMSSLQPMDWK